MMHPTPKLPVLDAVTFSGPMAAQTPCVLDHPGATFTQSGRASILLALESLQIGPGDQVLVPTYHCPTMVAPVVAVGAEPVFYPIDANGAPQLPWLAARHSERTRVLLAAHFFGLPQPMAALRQWCDLHQVALIEDCAHALFGTSGARPVGQWGDLAIASLTKFLPVPEGGCLLRNQGGVAPPNLRVPGVKHQVKSAFDIVHTSVNFGRLALLAPLIRAASGVRKLFKPAAAAPVPAVAPDAPPADGFSIDVARSHLALPWVCVWMAGHAHRQRIVERRRANYQFFAQALADVPGMRPLLPDLPAQCAPYVFPMWLDDPDPGYAELRRFDYPVSRWDWLWPTTPPIAGDHGKLWSHHVLQLACHQDLTGVELQRMVSKLRQVYASAVRTA